MSMMTYQESTRSRVGTLSLASLFGPAFAAITRLTDAWRRRQTERMLEGLDPDIRKDIGWPTTDTIPGRK